MELKDKTVLFLGDSITEGHGLPSFDLCYHQIIKNDYKLKHAINYGVGGTRVARLHKPYLNFPKGDLDFNLRLELMPKNLDIIVIMGGTNDFGHDLTPLGEIDSDSYYDFYGAYNNLINNIKRGWPNTKIVVVTPPKRAGEENLNFQFMRFSDFIDAIIKISERHNTYLIDLYHELGLNPYSPDDFQDGLHPTRHGHEVIGEYMGRKLFEL